MQLKQSLIFERGKNILLNVGMGVEDAKFDNFLNYDRGNRAKPTS